ncbi:TPA: Rid family hydrolase [Bacillus thuringiensis]
MKLDGTVPKDSAKQMQLALDNVQKNLKSTSMDIQNLKKLVFYLVEEIESDKRKAIISDFLNNHLPCTKMIYVVALASPFFKVEIDAWGCKEIEQLNFYLTSDISIVAL